MTDRDTITRRSDDFTAVLAATTDWDTPTPCEGWAVRDIVDHVIDTQRDFLTARDLPLPGSPDRSNPAEAWRQHRAAVDAAIADDAVLDTGYDGFFGPTTIGATLADFYGWDLVIHAWDIARSTGLDWQPDDAEVTRLGATADGWGPALHMEGVCGPEVPVADDATPQERLLARLGRDPRWQPGAR